MFLEAISSTKVPHTVADTNLHIRGGRGSSRPLRFLDQFGLKIRGATSPRSTTAIGVLAIAMIYHVDNYSATNSTSDLTHLCGCLLPRKDSLLTILVVWINADF